MWVFTQDGFVSAVRHNSQPDHLMVRARDEKSLHQLRGMTNQPIVKTPTGDYPYRVTVTEDYFKLWLMEHVADLQYTNFKSQVAVTRGKKYAHPLSDVWATMHEVEDDNARKRAS